MLGTAPFEEHGDLLDFAPVPRRLRGDGWLPGLQKIFIAALALTGSRNKAVVACGKVNAGIENLRMAEGAEEFNAAYDRALSLYEERFLARAVTRFGALTDGSERDGDAPPPRKAPPPPPKPPVLTAEDIERKVAVLRRLRADKLEAEARYRAEGRYTRSPQELFALWYVLSGDRWQDKPPADARSLSIFKDLFSRADSGSPFSPEELPGVAQALGSYFNAPEIALCAVGTQGARVEALDKLAIRLSEGPDSPAQHAILGFAASLVEVGQPYLPELLRKLQARFSTAAVWAGAFAGLWLPTRVLAEHNSLGRVVSKEIIKGSDLFAEPAADISLGELNRISGGAALTSNIPFRTLLARTIYVEVAPGVTVPARLTPESVRQGPGSSGALRAKQPSLNLSTQPDRGSEPVSDIQARLAKLEKEFAEFLRSRKRK